MIFIRDHPSHRTTVLRASIVASLLPPVRPWLRPRPGAAGSAASSPGPIPDAARTAMI